MVDKMTKRRYSKRITYGYIEEDEIGITAEEVYCDDPYDGEYSEILDVTGEPIFKPRETIVFGFTNG